MASSRARDGTNLKEKETSAHSSLLQRAPSSNERRSLRPSTPEKHLPVKQTPNNLKPKSIAPAMNAPKSTKSHQPTPTATVKRVAAQKPTEKPLPLSPKPRSPSMGKVRLPYAAPKQFSSLKPSMEKVSKSAASGKLRQVAKTKNSNSRTEAPAAVALIPSEALVKQKEKEQEHKEDVCDIVAEKLEHEQEPVDCATIEADLDDSPQQNDNAEKFTGAPQQMKEKNAEAINTEDVVVEPVNELESKSTNEGPEVQVVEPAIEEAEAIAKPSIQKVQVVEPAGEEAKPSIQKVKVAEPASEVAKPSIQKVKVAEPAIEEAKPAVIRAARDAPSRNVTVAKKEAVCHNDVIEEAKSKLLEKRKNKVLALVGAFETVMALQEPECQLGQH